MSESRSPHRKIRHAFLQDENQSCNTHACKCEELLKTVSELKAAVEQREKVITGQMKLLLETHAEQKVVLSKLLRQQNNSLELNQSFPIPSIEKLIALNSDITEHAYVEVMKYILKPCGVEKKLKIYTYILSNNVVMAYNIDGVHGKKSLKGLKTVYFALIGNECQTHWKSLRRHHKTAINKSKGRSGSERLEIKGFSRLLMTEMDYLLIFNEDKDTNTESFQSLFDEMACDPDVTESSSEFCEPTASTSSTPLPKKCFNKRKRLKYDEAEEDIKSP